MTTPEDVRHHGVHSVGQLGKGWFIPADSNRLIIHNHFLPDANGLFVSDGGWTGI